MKVILIFGASSSHGVGGARGGWADKLKTYVHGVCFGSEGGGEQYTIYELGIPGESTAMVLKRFEAEIQPRLIFGATPADTSVILAVGGNDAKATESPDNFVGSPEDYAKTFQQLVETAQKYSEHVVCLGHTPVDEAKTSPKRSPSGGLSYFTNSRMQAFEEVVHQVANKTGATFLPLFSEAPEDWQERCLFKDGLHPNDAGHQWIFERMRSSVDTILS